MGTLSQSLGPSRSLIVILLFLLIITPLPAQETLEDLERGLNLTPQQITKIEAIKKKYREELSSLTEEYLKKRLELMNEARGENPERERVRRLEEEIEILRAKREAAVRRYREEVGSILTPEQRKVLHDFQGKDKRRMRRAPKRGHRE